MPLNIPPIVYAVIAVLIMIGSAGWYFNYSQTKMQELAAEAATLSIAVDSLNAKSEAQELYRKLLSKELSAITSKNAKIEKDVKEYMSIFKRHNLTELAKKKPGLIESRINKGTKAVFKELEDETNSNS